MKHMSLRGAFALMLSLGLFFVSCKKGDTGPEGPQGEQGEQGEKGDEGDVGTANVIYSDWLDVEFLTSDSIFYEAEIDAPKLTDSILNMGTIKVYWNVNTDANPTIVSLPYHDDGVLFGVPDLSIIPVFRLETIYLYSYYPINSFTTSASEKAWQYRYVLIPGGVNARSSINWDDYAQVKKHLGLKD